MPDRESDSQFWRREMRRKLGAFTIRGPILIVDDNPDDAKLVLRACQQLHPQFPITVLGSGRELLAHLQGLGTSSNPAASMIPSVILLDLKMPEMDGFAVMEWMASQPPFAKIPVIALTIFDDLPHLSQAYALGARTYLIKPVTGQDLRQTLASLNISP